MVRREGQAGLAAVGKMGRIENFGERERHGAPAYGIIIHGQKPDGRIDGEVCFQAWNAEQLQQVQRAGESSQRGRSQIGRFAGELLEQAFQRGDHLPNRKQGGQPGAFLDRSQPVEKLKENF